MTVQLDRMDRNILLALGREGRISMADLALKVGLSKTPVQARVKRGVMALVIGGEPACDIARVQGPTASLQRRFGGIGDEAAVVAQGEHAIEGLIGPQKAQIDGRTGIGLVDIHDHALEGVVAVVDGLTDGETGGANLGHAETLRPAP